MQTTTLDRPLPIEVRGELNKLLYHSGEPRKLLPHVTEKDIEKLINFAVQIARQEGIEEGRTQEREKKNLALHMARLIWKLRDEINAHMEIAQKYSKDTNQKQWEEHFSVHLGGYDTLGIFMKAVRFWYPEIYQRKGKTIKEHFDEVEKYFEALTQPTNKELTDTKEL